ncbi:TIGR03013 family PEP-CTERM/XrtA system glycosyltransferase [Pseudodesulfovibrio thermohalotolerans]|jgi:sugar transferase (PEP-CTERM system associated)|uniref:TIGR03013 family XrtA/PEP-CTERM system glycosyltransferase n=1 Tax=Pseudodesulfovibrio thermohalotolerans TaxID=2880651 RepID=UPI002441C668|nr:TIGR03013 family XrtA/PEP-CTERM system glycosyltransferase [Pseudodesulfovibrio thermohalotolerans]WFS61609.1 TIGR03013 family PEP-CTERM/XrtA system glycosyltransferase [Pseudodesulfovibrio thermohalotolerans]
MVAIASVRVFKDLLLLVLAMFLCSVVLFNEPSEMLALFEGRPADVFVLMGIILASFLVVHIIVHYLAPSRNAGVLGLVISLIVASNMTFFIYWQTDLFVRLEEMIPVLLCLFGLNHTLWLLFIANWRKIPGLVHRVVIVGNGQLAEDMKLLAVQSGGRYEFKDYVECLSGEFADPVAQVENPTNRILEAAQRAKASKIVVSLTERREAFPLQEILNCKLSGIEVLEAPEFYERVNRKLMLEKITPSWFIFAKGFKIIGIRRFIKRALDILLSLTGIIIVSPILPLVMIGIKLDSPGPVLFKQIRVGKGDKDFIIYKFRSMRQDAEKGSGAVWAMENDNRVTRFGRFLRKSRIDEIPQLFNVLMGSMSLVGPRPERPEFVHELKKIVPYYAERHFVKPGITGWAQVCYPYGASVQDAFEKLRYDMYYIKNYSLWFDFKIMFKTISVMLNKMGR